MRLLSDFETPEFFDGSTKEASPQVRRFLDRSQETVLTFVAKGDRLQLLGGVQLVDIAAQCQDPLHTTLPPEPIARIDTFLLSRGVSRGARQIVMNQICLPKVGYMDSEYMRAVSFVDPAVRSSVGILDDVSRHIAERISPQGSVIVFDDIGVVMGARGVHSLAFGAIQK